MLSRCCVLGRNPLYTTQAGQSQRAARAPLCACVHQLFSVLTYERDSPRLAVLFALREVRLDSAWIVVFL